MKTHKLNHTNERQFKCHKCVYVSNVKDDMDKHMILHSEDSRSAVNKSSQGRQMGNVLENLNIDVAVRQHFIDSLLSIDRFSDPIRNGKPMTMKNGTIIYASYKKHA